MDNSGYVSLTRQSGLLREMQLVANNIANVSTTGYRRQGLIFAEEVRALGNGAPSLSMASGEVRALYSTQGGLTRTGGSFDLAIQGDGYFLIETPQGQQLTRAGSFTPNEAGELVTPDGLRVLDAGGAPIFIPPDAASIAIASDGTVSADGQPAARIGLYRPTDPNDLNHRDGVRFAAPGGVEPVEDGTILQGFLEESNVNPVQEIARMIEVQRAYELGQKMLDREDERIRTVLQTLGK